MNTLGRTQHPYEKTRISLYRRLRRNRSPGVLRAQERNVCDDHQQCHQGHYDRQEVDHCHYGKEDRHVGQLHLFDCRKEEGGWNFYFVVNRHEEESQHRSIAFAERLSGSVFLGY